MAAAVMLKELMSARAAKQSATSPSKSKGFPHKGFVRLNAVPICN